MNFNVSNFTESERELLAEPLQPRDNKPVSTKLANSELKLDPASATSFFMPMLTIMKPVMTSTPTRGIAC